MVFGKTGINIALPQEPMLGPQLTPGLEVKRPGIGTHLDQQRALLDVLMKSLTEMDNKLGIIMLPADTERQAVADDRQVVSGISELIIENNRYLENAINMLGSMYRRIDL